MIIDTLRPMLAKTKITIDNIFIKSMHNIYSFFFILTFAYYFKMVCDALYLFWLLYLFFWLFLLFFLFTLFRLLFLLLLFLFWLYSWNRDNTMQIFTKTMAFWDCFLPSFVKNTFIHLTFIKWPIHFHHIQIFDLLKSIN